VYNVVMRRKQGELVPLEKSIMAAAQELRDAGTPEFYGFQMAKELKDKTKSRFLTGYGTLYRALGRLEDMGYLQSRWEELDTSDGMSRPRRRFYSIGIKGER